MIPESFWLHVSKLTPISSTSEMNPCWRVGPLDEVKIFQNLTAYSERSPSQNAQIVQRIRFQYKALADSQDFHKQT